MLKSFIKAYSIVFLLLFFFSCSSDRFAKRQYLSGRYVDKIEVPAKSNSVKTEDFSLNEYPLSADNNSTCPDIKFNEDTIPKIQTDTLSNENELEDVIQFSPDSLKKITNKGEEHIDVAKQQLVFNRKLKVSAIKILFA